MRMRSLCGSPHGMQARPLIPWHASVPWVSGVSQIWTLSWATVGNEEGTADQARG